MDKLYFAKIKPEATIPSKLDEDGGYDIYPCFKEEVVIISPNDIVAIPTGIASSFSNKYRMRAEERGSTGSIGLSKRCGVIDSGFRGEWKVFLNNTTGKAIVISKNHTKKKELNNLIYYPYTKAICQVLLEEVPKVEVEEISYEELLTHESNRGNGMLGSSGK